jgi:hypothetical protein
MVKTVKFGTLIKLAKPFIPRDTSSSRGTSRMQVNPTTCKSGTLTVDGSKSSSMSRIALSMLKQARYLKCKAIKIKKDKKLESGTDIMDPTKSGKSSIPMNMMLTNQPKVSTRTLGSILEDLSTLSQNFQ